MSILQARGLTVRYGGVRALTDVDLTVEPGELVGLIGPNGAGKTTFIDALTGFAPHTGRVTVTGHDLSRAPAHRRARFGLARPWQSGDLFDDLSVVENVAVAGERASWPRLIAGSLLGPGRTSRPALDALRRVGLETMADAEPTDLSQGQRKLVGVARALAGRPRVVCLDEPAAGLDTQESAELGTRLRAVVDDGTAMVLVDHDMGLVLGVCDRVVVLEFGVVIAAGRPDEVRENPAVVAAYLGGSASTEEVSQA